MKKTRKNHKRKRAVQQRVEWDRKRRAREALLCMERIAAAYGQESNYALLLKKYDYFFNNVRYSSVVFKSARTGGISARQLKAIKESIGAWLHQERVPLAGTSTIVSLFEWLTAALSLFSIVTCIVETKNDERAVEMLAALAPFREQFDDSVLGPRNILGAFMLYMSDYLSRMDRGYVWFSTGKSHPGHGHRILECYEVHRQPAESKRFVIEGIERNGYRFGRQYLASIRWETVREKQLYGPGAGGGELNVYFQGHAIQRMRERLAPLDNGMINHFVSRSLNEPRVVRDHAGRSMLALHSKETVLGYLLYNRFGKDILVRTFLFVTHDSTPEGRRLNRLLDVHKLEKKYLGLDTFSTFVETDLRHDEKMKELFARCGCEGLFTMEIDQMEGRPLKKQAEEIRGILRVDEMFPEEKGGAVEAV